MNDIDIKERTQKMKAIWFCVGLILLLTGSVIVFSGLYTVIFHIKGHTALAYLHPDLWWGSIMVVIGIIFVVKNKS